MSDEELVEDVGIKLRRLYFSAFRHGFFSCMCGVLLFYVFFT